MKPSVLIALLTSVVLALHGLSGCGGQSEEARLDKAGQMLEQRDRAGAVVELKSLLAKNPNSARGRLLFGRALLANGDAASAELELSRAVQLGVAPDDVVPELADALLAQGKAAQLLAQFGSTRLTRPGPAANFLTTLAEAHAISGSQPDASRVVAEALRLQPGHPAARLLESRLTAAGGDLATAMKQLDALLAKSPREADAWVFKAELLSRQSAPDDAVLGAFRKAQEAAPDNVAAQVGVLTLLMNKGDFEAAKLQQQAMAKVLPQHPKTLYFEALLAQQRGDERRARELSQLLLKRAPNDPQVLLLAGRSELKAGALAQAETLLVKAVQLATNEPAQRLLLAQVLLRTGQAERALGIVKPLTTGSKPNVDALLLAAQAALRKGDAAEAERLFARASQGRPNDAHVQLARTMARSGKGQDDAMLVELQALAAAEKTGTDAAMALVSAYLSRQQFDAALKALDTLSARQPGLAWPDNLRGRIALQRKDPAAARRYFEAALAKDEDHFPAIAMLVSLDLADKKPADAMARLDALLKRRPRHLEAQLARVELKARGGATQSEVRAMLEEVVRTHPLEPLAHRALIDHAMASGESRQALALARAAAANLPNHVEILDRLGRAQQQAGELVQAESTFKRLGELQPGRAQPLLRQAETELMRGQVEAARESIRRARAADPTDVDALRATLSMALRDQRPADAMQLAREWQARRPADPLGLILQGDVEASQAHWPQAQAAYRQAFDKAPGSIDAALHLHKALIEGGKLAEADQLAATWQASHPGDAAFQHQRASAVLEKKEYADAEARYADLHKRRPNDVLALNNLAYALVRQNKSGAVPLAERAVQLAPGQASLMDTLAMALAADKQLAKAIEWQRKAVELAPTSGTLRMNLVKLYLQTGDKGRARDELGQVAQARPAYPNQTELARLQTELGVSPLSALDKPTAAIDPLPQPSPSVAPSRVAAPEAATDYSKFLLLAGALVASAAAIGIPVVLVMAALRPPLYRVERSAHVNLPAEALFDRIADLHQWEHWSALRPFEAAMTRHFSGAATGLGAVCNWVGPGKSSEGYVEVVKCLAPKSLTATINHTRPEELGEVREYVLSAEPAGGTLVRAIAGGPASYGQRVVGLVWRQDRRIGHDLSAELGRLMASAAAGPVPTDAADHGPDPTALGPAALTG